MRNKFLLLSLVLLSSQSFCWAANIPYTNSGVSESPEDFRAEVTGSYWSINSRGALSTSSTAIHFLSDLNVKQQQPTFYGKLVFKPRRKQRIIVEGIPFHLNGYNTAPRTFVYRDKTFSANETLKSSGDLTFVFGGYQYDIISGPTGHMGISAGAAFLSGSGNITAVQHNTTVARTGTGAVPLAGGDFRVYPIHNRAWFDVDGNVRGMELGPYGHYLEANLNGSFWFRQFGISAGYRGIDTHLAKANSNVGIFARIQGPVFSLSWKW